MSDPRNTPSTPKKNVLVVEDDPDSRAAICTILETLGFDHVSFGSGVEALKVLTTRGPNHPKIDLALLDIMMPQMSGYELLTEMRKRSEFRELPVIMVTAKDGDSEILEGYQHGADYYITKPFTAKQLEYGIRIFIPTAAEVPPEKQS